MAYGAQYLGVFDRYFGEPLTFKGVPIGRGTIDTTLGSSPDGVGMDVQRKVTVLRVRAGVLAGWERDDEVMCGGTRYRIREKLDDARTIDGAWDLFSVGVG